MPPACITLPWRGCQGIASTPHRLSLNPWAALGIFANTMTPEAQPAATPSQSTLRFEPFRILRSQRILLDGDRQVRLSSRAFDVLLALIDRAGEVIDKRDLIAAVWPNTVVRDQPSGPHYGPAPCPGGPRSRQSLHPERARTGLYILRSPDPRAPRGATVADRAIPGARQFPSRPTDPNGGP